MAKTQLKYPKREVECRYCHKKFDRNVVPEGTWIESPTKWFYHTECYPKAMELRKAKKITDTASETEWKDSTYYFLKNHLKIAVNYPLFDKQWQSNLKKKRTPKGIYFALVYFYDIKKNSVERSNGAIGIVDYIYDDSREYWKQQNQRDSDIIKRIEEQAKKQAEAQKQIVRKTTSKKKNNRKIYSMEDDED